MTEKTAKTEANQHRQVPAFRTGRDKAPGVRFPAHVALLSRADTGKSGAFSSSRAAVQAKR